MKFADWRIGSRLSAGIAALLLLALIMGGVGLWSMRAYDIASSDMESALHGEVLATEWERLLEGHASAVDAYLHASEPALLDRLRTTVERQVARGKKILADERALAPARAQSYLDSIERAALAFDTQREQAMQHKAAGAGDEATDGMQARWDDYTHAVEELRSRTEVVSKASAAHARSTYEQGRALLLGCGALTLAVGLLIGWTLTRSITRPIAHAVQVANTVAGGDLTQVITVPSQDETGQLLRALGRMNDSLAHLVTQIRSGSENISVASGEIASGNANLSSRTEQQAASLQQTAASMEELASTVKLNADNARQADQLATSASEVAARGGADVAEVVTTMNAIATSSGKMAEIVSVIDGIAFQTNILALNAAVEAARAGEQGKGFAVVAGEVQSLAQRSAQAAKEIKVLIDDSVGKVNTGALQVERAGATMQEIVSSVRQVTSIMGEISAASEEQSRGIDQVNQAVSQMDESTQQNAALVEQAAAAATALQDQAQGLVATVAVFKLN